MTATLTLALSKGRIFDETLPLLRAAGIEVLEDPETSRKLILPTSNPNLRLLIVRASDVPTYVQHGAADLGIAGKDVLIEHGGEGLYQPVDLNIAKCRMMVAAPLDYDYQAAVRRGARLRYQSCGDHHAMPSGGPRKRRIGRISLGNRTETENPGRRKGSETLYRS